MKGTAVAVGAALLASFAASFMTLISLAAFGGPANGWMNMPLITNVFLLSPVIGFLAVLVGAVVKRGTAFLLALGLAPILFQAFVFIFMILPGRLA